LPNVLPLVALLFSLSSCGPHTPRRGSCPPCHLVVITIAFELPSQPPVTILSTCWLLPPPDPVFGRSLPRGLRVTDYSRGEVGDNQRRRDGLTGNVLWFTDCAYHHGRSLRVRDLTPRDPTRRGVALPLLCSMPGIVNDCGDSCPTVVPCYWE
jgi:hypothetical protein